MKKTAIVLGIIALAAIAGCAGFLDTTPDPGQILIENKDDVDHTVIINIADHPKNNVTVGDNSNKKIKAINKPGNYTIQATTSGNITKSTTDIQYYSAGKDGDELGGPGIILTIESDGAINFELVFH